MDDLGRRFSTLDSLEMPDLWPEVERRASSQTTESVRPRTVWRGQPGRLARPSVTLAVLAGLAVASIGGGMLIGNWLNGPTPSTVVGCFVEQGMHSDISIGTAECEFFAAEILEHVPDDRGTPFAILVDFFVCPDLCMYPDGFKVGSATVEYADGREPIDLTIRGSLEAPTFEARVRSWTGLKEPTSPRVEGAGPFPFSLGHCGLSWYVDFDSSYWVPVGLVDGRASAVISSESGEMLLLGPDRVQFQGESGFTAQLARFPGPKHIWLCR